MVYFFKLTEEEIMKKTVSFFLAFIMIFTLCACNNAPLETPVPTPESTEPSYLPTSFRNNGKRTVVHSMPQKIVTAGPNCTEVMCALGLEDKVVGKCMTNHSKGVLDEYKDAYRSIPTLCEGYPTLDEIVDSGCDFLYASSWIFDDTLTVKALEDKGIIVYVNEATTYDELWMEINDLNRVFCLEDTGDAVVKAQTDRISAVGEVVKDQQPKKVLVLDSFIGEKVFTAGKANIETSYIASAGGANVFGDREKAWDAVTVDDIVAANPDYIIIHDYKGSSFDDKVAALKENSELKYLDCVRNERFIKLSLENAMPGMRSAVTVENRFNGYKDALLKAGLKPEEDLMFECDNRADAESITPAVLQGPNPPDAFFCVNDDTAIGVMYTAKSMGLRTFFISDLKWSYCVVSFACDTMTPHT